MNKFRITNDQCQSTAIKSRLTEFLPDLPLRSASSASFSSSSPASGSPARKPHPPSTSTPSRGLGSPSPLPPQSPPDGAAASERRRKPRPASRDDLEWTVSCIKCAVDMCLAELEDQRLEASRCQRLEEEGVQLRHLATHLHRQVTQLTAQLARTNTDLNHARRCNQQSRDTAVDSTSEEVDRRHFAQIDKVIEDYKMKLRKLSALVDGQEEEMIHQALQLRRQGQLLLEARARADEADRLAADMAEQLNDTDHEMQTSKLIQHSRIGQRCLSEGHTDTINRQAQALAQARQNIAGGAAPPGDGTQADILPGGQPPEAARLVHEVAFLQQQLEGLRTKRQAAEEQAAGGGTGGDLAPGAKFSSHLRESYHFVDTTQGQLAAERAAAARSRELLDLADTGYVSLVQRLVKALDPAPATSALPATLLPPFNSAALKPLAWSDHDYVIGERCKIEGVILTKLDILWQRLEAKDKLLSKYDEDLSLLALAQEQKDSLAARSSLLKDTVDKYTQEVEYLRQSLANSRDAYEREVAKNAAIKAKKVLLPAEVANSAGVVKNPNKSLRHIKSS